MKVTALAALAAVLAGTAIAAPANGGHSNPGKQLPGGKSVKEPSYFTSAFSTRAVPTTIINNDGDSVPGQTGAFGHFGYRVNSDKEIICWDLRTVNVTGDYMSPAVTATHIHEGEAGSPGPPRLAFPNPRYVRNDITGAEIRESKGCMKGPFKTGVPAANGGADTGAGFSLKQLEANPTGFFGDTHTVEFSAGAVRGQLLPSEREVSKPKYFTSTLKTEATPNQIINNSNVRVDGLAGAKGKYTLRLNTDKDVLCYDITLTGFAGQEYFSPAKTSTHTHMADFGLSGPPRLAYKNPQPKKLWWGGKSKKTRTSSACIKGPFTTGLLNDAGIDTGSASGFTLSQLQDDPTSYMSDVHTESKQAGAVRGNMYRP